MGIRELLLRGQRFADYRPMDGSAADDLRTADRVCANAASRGVQVNNTFWSLFGGDFGRRKTCSQCVKRLALLQESLQ